MSSDFFHITPPTVFVHFLRKLARMFYVPIRKKTGTDFQNFAVNVFGEFFKFLIETHSVEKRK